MRSKKRKKKRVLPTFIIVLTLLLIIILSKNIWLQSIADYLMVENNSEPSDVIIVLGGEWEGERTERAVELYQNGSANRLLFSDGTKLSWRTRAAEEMVALAKYLKVPDEAIFTEDYSRSTYENALYTKEFLQEKGWTSAIVVTTEWHTRRSKFIFDKVFKDSGIALTYAGAKDKRYDTFQQWWQDSEKQQVILTEWAKLLVYWLKY